MFRGYRLLFAAITGLVLFALSPLEAGQQFAPAEMPNSASMAYPNRCFNNNDRDYSERCAQWRATIAAEKSAKFSEYGNWFALAGSALSLLSIILVLRALKVAREANMIQRPPRLAAVQVQLDMAAGALNGRLHIINEGRSRATIVRSAIHVIVSSNGLPQTHPTASKPDHNKIEVDQLAAGETVWWQFHGSTLIQSQADAILNGTDGWRAYVTGLLHYQDTLGDFHHTLFCREYDPTRRRWMPVDDPDYEYQH